jgi:hypothetical protein
MKGIAEFITLIERSCLLQNSASIDRYLSAYSQNRIIAFIPALKSAINELRWYWLKR